jgi:hypothetical protein
VDLLESTPREHPEHAVIAAALELVSEAAGHCDEFLTLIHAHNEAFELHEELGKVLGLE